MSSILLFYENYFIYIIAIQVEMILIGKDKYLLRKKMCYISWSELYDIGCNL